MALIASAAVLAGATQLDPAKVDSAALTHETQLTIHGDDQLDIVWFIPMEFWQQALAQNKRVTEAQATDFLKGFDGVCTVAVIRADTPAGRFKYYSKEQVRDNLVLAYTDGAGTVTQLEEQTELTPETAAVLAAMKPMLKAAMGALGDNCHLFVLKDAGPEGMRRVSPLTKGTLTAELKPVGANKGGKVTFEFPLNSLFVPPVCPQCKPEGKMSWSYCPYCGKELPK